MKNVLIHISRYVIVYFLLISILVVFFLSYKHFIFDKDYLIEYERNCNPSIARCFVRCVDDVCDEKKYYFKMIKYASDLYQECKNDVTECSEADRCLMNNRQCSMTYCEDNSGEICSNNHKVPRSIK